MAEGGLKMHNFHNKNDPLVTIRVYVWSIGMSHKSRRVSYMKRI